MPESNNTFTFPMSRATKLPYNSYNTVKTNSNEYIMVMQRLQSSFLLEMCRAWSEWQCRSEIDCLISDEIQQSYKWHDGENRISNQSRTILTVEGVEILLNQLKLQVK